MLADKENRSIIVTKLRFIMAVVIGLWVVTAKKS